jgi:uncharacterized membrane protein YgaE (UPF0421/DUF939 family)
VSYLGGLRTINQAPSAVGMVVRYDEKMSRKRAWARFFGTIGGAFMASVVLGLVTSVTVLVWAGAVFAVLNGLFKKTKLGMMPLFYTATILLLYSTNDVSAGYTNVVQRVAYNLVGITIGILVVIYPFPRILQMINPKLAKETEA